MAHLSLLTNRKPTKANFFLYLDLFLLLLQILNANKAFQSRWGAVAELLRTRRCLNYASQQVDQKLSQPCLGELIYHHGASEPHIVSAFLIHCTSVQNRNCTCCTDPSIAKDCCSFLLRDQLSDQYSLPLYTELNDNN